MIEEFLSALEGAGVEYGWQEAADALWLGQAMAMPTSEPLRTEPVPAPPPLPPPESLPPSPTTRGGPLVRRRPGSPPFVEQGIHRMAPMPHRTARPTDGGTLLRINPPLRKPLPDGLGIGRALRRFGRRRPSPTARRTDIDATIARYCETGVLVPVTVPASEAWFREIALVVDGNATMVVWEQTVRALAGLLKQHRAFGRVTQWTVGDDSGRVRLATAAGSEVRPSQLVHSIRHQLVLVVTDGTGPIWRGAAIHAMLREWGRSAPLVLIQMLAPRQWPATALGEASVSVVSTGRGVPNRNLLVQPSWWWAEDGPPEHAAPIISLHPRTIDAWARMVMGGDRTPVPAVLTEPVGGQVMVAPTVAIAPRRRVEMFFATVSRTAARLAALLSAVEVDLPVAEILLDALIPDGQQVHLAEVLVGGLLHELPPASDQFGGHRYEFEPGVRAVLQETLTTTDAFDIWRTVAPYLELITGRPAPFSHLVELTETPPDGGETRLAEITNDLIERMGLRGSPLSARVPLLAGGAAAVVEESVDEALRELQSHDTDEPETDLQRRGARRSIVAEVSSAPLSRSSLPALFTLSCYHDVSQVAVAVLKRTRAPIEDTRMLGVKWLDLVEASGTEMQRTWRPK